MTQLWNLLQRGIFPNIDISQEKKRLKSSRAKKDLTKTIVAWALYNNIESFSKWAVDHRAPRNADEIQRSSVSYLS